MSLDDFFYGNTENLSRRDQMLVAREDLIYNVTEDILVEMEKAGVSKSELASDLSKSKSFITQVLNGSRNMTLGTLSNICFALNLNVEISVREKQVENNAESSEPIAESGNVINCTTIFGSPVSSDSLNYSHQSFG